MSFKDGDLHVKVDELEKQVEKLKVLNGELCAEVNEKDELIRELELRKLYGVDTWCDLDDEGQSYILPELYRTRESAEKRANRYERKEDGLGYYATVVEFKVVD